MKQIIPPQAHRPSDLVKIDQGFGNFTYGLVVSYDSREKNVCGWRGNYRIEVTGGVDMRGKPARVGEIRTALHTHVSKV